MQTTRLRAIITVRIMAPHPQNHKDHTDSGTSSASLTTTFKDSVTSTTKEVR